MPVCLFLAGTMMATLPCETFVLTWTHSVERTEWREEWRVDGADLVLVEASVEGSGAGMQPADGAWLEDGRWHWRPLGRRQARLLLANSGYGGDYRLCWQDVCRLLAGLLPKQSPGPVEIAPCSWRAGDAASARDEENKK